MSREIFSSAILRIYVAELSEVEPEQEEKDTWTISPYTQLQVSNDKKIDHAML